MQKTLDLKLAELKRNPTSRVFILADAKDADMAFGISSTGQTPEGSQRSLGEYRDQMRQIICQALVDIVLMSASTSELITIREGAFDGSSVTPACRANDTTDIHLLAGGTYAQQPSRPFRTALIDHIQAGKLDPTPAERATGASLGLYSITPNNDLNFDYPTLMAYNEFREEAERKGFRHFLEVFDPNACGDHSPADLGRFINDLIVRTLAGVATRGRPIFLKVAYHGPAAMEELASFDPHLVPGILGGSSGTTFDAFHQLWEARKYGARAALYGRMINNSEHQTTFIQHLRLLADGEIEDPAEAVKSYHGSLQKLGIKPIRPLADDLQRSSRAAAYSGSASVAVSSAQKPEPPTAKSAAAAVDRKTAGAELDPV